jgi:hypothetical protein
MLSCREEAALIHTLAAVAAGIATAMATATTTATAANPIYLVNPRLQLDILLAPSNTADHEVLTLDLLLLLPAWYCMIN